MRQRTQRIAACASVITVAVFVFLIRTRHLPIIGACDAKEDKTLDMVQQQWMRVQSDFEVIKMIDSGQDKNAMTVFSTLAKKETVCDRGILRDFASGRTNNVRTTLDLMINGWIIQEACHSQHPPLTVLLDDPERLQFLGRLAIYRKRYPIQPFDTVVDKTVAEILCEAERRVSESTDDGVPRKMNEQPRGEPGNASL
jgi:hypothetical protein